MTIANRDCAQDRLEPDKAAAQWTAIGHSKNDEAERQPFDRRIAFGMHHFPGPKNSLPSVSSPHFALAKLLIQRVNCDRSLISSIKSISWCGK